MKHRSALLAAIVVFAASLNISIQAQIAPGPYEILPFQDGFIHEAWMDLQAGTGMADWTGWSGSSWISPAPYEGHIGSDFSVQTGTPLYATAAGTVSAIGTGFAANDHSTYYGNYVRVAVDGTAPNGESLNVTYGHMLSVAVTVGQRVSVGTQVGLSDNTGNSTTEHLHFQSDLRTGTNTCPFYWAHFKYPIMFNQSGTHQVGYVIKITAASTPIRNDRYDTSTQISTAFQNQLYFSSQPKRGYYQIFIPNNTSYRCGWVKATDVAEVFTGTVIQALPDKVTYVHTGQLATKYAIRNAASDTATQIATIYFGGGRFVADQVSNGYYRIPVPGSSATWGWVKPTARMVVYPQLTNPNVNLSTLPNNNFPISNNFTTTGKSMFGRPKFNRSVVKAFSPAAPGGDGNALFITDSSNYGDGTCESVTVGTPGQRNYYVQSYVYFNYKPSYLASGEYERYGVFLRDDGFAGLDTTFEGAGNCYALFWDNDDGRLRCAKCVDGVVTDFLPTIKYFTTTGWRKLRIEANNSTISFYVDGVLQVSVTDTTFTSGQCGIGYSEHAPSYPAGRGAYFDNFIADSLDTPPSITTQPASQTVTAGSSVTFTVTASGTAPLSYQWKFNGSAISGATTSSYTKSNVQGTDAGTYTVTVSNAAGSVTSANATLTVNAAVTAPSGLTATAVSASQIDLSWTDNSSNEDGFRVERSTDNVTFTQFISLSANVTGTSDTGLTAGTTYYYRVRAYNANGNSAYSNTASATTPVPTPAAPSGLTATTASSSQINLSWVDNANNEDGYRVERSTDNVTFTQIVSLSANVTATSDTGLSASTTYYYRVRAYNSYGNSGYSNTASATTSNPSPALSPISNQTVSEGQALTFTASATNPNHTVSSSIFATWEGNNNGDSEIVFRKPANSGTTTAFIDTAYTNYTVVATGAPSGVSGAKALKIQWNFKTGMANYWVRLTTASAPTMPNPTIGLDQTVTMKIYTTKALRVGIGCRETASTAAYGADGGLTGTIDWAGVTNVVSSCPVASHAVAASNWTTLNLNIPFEPQAAFTGDGKVDQSGAKGVLEHLVLRGDGGTGTYTVYLDDLGVITANDLVFSLDSGAPTGASIERRTGKFSWTPAAGQAGTYNITARVTDRLGLQDYKTFQVTVNSSATPPSITTQPVSQTVNQGANVTFSVVASGTAPLSYQWTFNGANISGATTSSLTKTAVQTTDAGNYAVVVSNSAGSVTSATATLTVNVPAVPPSITTQPASQAVNPGASATFTVVATGTAPLSYQWTFNGANISGATTSSYTKSNVQSTDAGSYAVVVSNSQGSVTSANAVLSVNVPPSITTQPASQTVNQGASVTFSVAATGTAPLSYQWTFNGANISGATAASYTKSNVQSADAGNYAAVVSNVAGSATSTTATLTVNVPPSITTQPASQSVARGANVTFTVAATGTSPLSYQWKFNGADIAGATTTSFSKSNVQSTDAGSYSVAVANVAGSATSANAVLAVNSAPTVTLGTARSTEPVVSFETITDYATDHVMFRKPAYSGTTTSFIDTAATNYTFVTTTFPAGNASAGTKVLKAGWTFKTGTTNPWLRLTTVTPTLIPNPTIDFTARLRFDVYSDKSIDLGLGIRETSTTAEVGGNGGTTGTIEWIGVTNKSGSTPLPNRTIPAATWTTVEFNIPAEPIVTFTGDGIIQGAKGVLEHLVILPKGGMGAYTMYLDNFQVVTTTALPGTVTTKNGSTLTFTASATDPDAGQTMSYSLDAGAPTGASINATTGAFTWNPSLAQANTTNSITVRATDNGTPSQSDAKAFTVIVTSDAVAVQGNPAALETLVLKWQAVPGATYQIQFKRGQAGEWANLDAPFTSNVAEESVEITDSTPGTIYRVIELSTPVDE